MLANASELQLGKGLVLMLGFPKVLASEFLKVPSKAT